MGLVFININLLETKGFYSNSVLLSHETVTECSLSNGKLDSTNFPFMPSKPYIEFN